MLASVLINMPSLTECSATPVLCRRTHHSPEQLVSTPRHGRLQTARQCTRHLCSFSAHASSVTASHRLQRMRACCSLNRRARMCVMPAVITLVYARCRLCGRNRPHVLPTACAW